tara:strand:- start:231 stop:2135 length:1905 start_codon:yes stop_codon:yes gene_type:complete
MPYIGNIVQDFSVSTAMLNTDSVTSIKVLDGTIVNADINASAAIAGTKISPDFGSQNIATTGALDIGANAAIFGTLTISNATPTLIFTEDDANPDYKQLAAGGEFVIQNNQGGSYATRFKINADGHIDIAGNVDFDAGIDVTGTITSNYLTLTAVNPNITFTDTNENPDFQLGVNSGQFKIIDTSGSGADRLIVQSNGTIDVEGNLDANGGLDVTGATTLGGNVEVTGTTDGVLNLDTSDSRGAFVRFGQGGSFHNMVGCADGLITGLDKEDLGIRATDKIGFATNGDDIKMTILSGGNIGIGITSPDTLLHLAGGSPYIKLHNTGTSASANDIFGALIFQHSDADDAGITAKIECVAEDNAGNSRLSFHNGDGGNADERIRILSGGQVNIGDDLTQTDRTVSIHGGSNTGQLQVKGTEADIWMSSTGANGIWRLLGSTGNTTHRFRIYDSTNGKEPFFIEGSSGTNTSHVHINSGNLKFDQSGTGIDFHNFGTGTNVTSNLLDDYEEGTFTPAVTSGLSAGQIAYNSRSAKYTKVGNTVYFTFHININSATLDGGSLKFGGLPFTAANVTHTAGGAWKIFTNGNIDANATYKVQGDTTDILVVTAAGDAMAANATSIDAGHRHVAYWGFYFVS